MNDRDELARILRGLEAAENAGDADYIVSMMADDMVIMVPNVTVQEGKDACAEFLRGMLAWMIESLHRQIEYVSAEIRVLGDHAFDRGTFAFTATAKSGGDTAHAQGKYFWLYSRDADGSWKLARMIVSLDEPPEDDDGVSVVAPE
jgi:uncharacterized protein (TIGR02246 family)